MAEEKQEQLLPDDTRQVLKKDLSELRDPVTVVVFTDGEENKPFADFAVKLLKELSEVSDKIRPQFERLGGDAAARHGVDRSPTLLIQPERYAIRLTGAPAGEEAKVLILSIIMASTGASVLSDASRRRLGDLKDKRAIKVFVSPTCPYCPLQSVLAVAAAVEKPGLISTEIVEIYENRDLATQYDALSVPQTFIDERLVGQGLQPEEVFVEEIVTAAPVQVKPVEGEGTIERDLVVIGAGPAGLTAAIYAERSGLRSIVLDKSNIGGQVAITPIVENYPGFTRIGGRTLMDMMAQQAVNYTTIHEGEEVVEITSAGNRFEISTSRRKYLARAVLLSTGAESKKLGVTGEKRYQGRGVSYCAACDGYFFKGGKKVIVVGGGNTAATEALYLKNIGVDVRIVHRRDELRAEQYLQQSLADNKIPVVWNSVVTEILGDKLVNAAVIEDTKEKKQERLQVDGVFIAIGYAPNNALAVKLGVEVDDEGYVKVDAGYRTNVKGVYAAGDITGGVKQIVTAVGQGAGAAMAIFEDLAKPYWTEKQA